MRDRLGLYLQGTSLFLIGASIFLFPLLFTSLTTDLFVLPKQFLVSGAALVVLLLVCIKMVVDKTVTLRRTPYDLPVFLLLLAVFLSSVFSVNKAESLTAFATLFFSVLFFYLITQVAKTQKAVSLLTLAFFEGGVVLAILYILTFAKVYVLPIDYVKNQAFSPFGTLVEQAVYIASCLIFAFSLSYRPWKEKKLKLNGDSRKLIMFGVAALELVILLGGLVATLYGIYKFQRPVILPFDTGFQVGFAAISQDPGRTVYSFLFGSGFGTFATDFARFKQAIFNQNQALWSLTFFRSSSLALDLLATTGILGILAYLYLVFKVVKDKPLFVPVVFLLVLSFVLPFSSLLQTLIFVILGIYVAGKGLENKHYYDVELGLVASKSGIPTLTTNDRVVGKGLSRVLPLLVLLLDVVIVGALGFLVVRYIQANTTFQKSLVAASKNNGNQAYQLQSDTLNLVGYNDAYYRVFSQTNLAIANSISNSVPKGASPSAQTSQTITTLIQQSINSARSATLLSPLSAIDWQNLSSIYRSLIGFGKNADAFAVLASQQAIVLDPTNPQEYLDLGGLYYQLKLWDKAIEQFQIAINLKPDFANAYYNMAHALQQKGDLKSALAELDQVKTLVKNNPQTLKQIQTEIDGLQKGINSPTPTPTTQLPTQNPPVAIPAPTTPSPTPAPTK